MIEFRLSTGEKMLLRVSCIMALFPEQRQIRTQEHGWTITVHKDDWDDVLLAFTQVYRRIGI